MARKKKIGIIGAGLGGLSASVRLAKVGFDVHLFERNSMPGGKAYELRSGGFRFDKGPSLLTMPFVLEELFTYAGEKIEDWIKLIKPDSICKYFYPDGTTINAYSDKEKFAREIEQNTADSARSVIDYLRYAERIYNTAAPVFLFGSFGKLTDFFSRVAVNSLLNIFSIDPFRTMHSANSSFFKDKKTVQLFDRYATYNGSNPYKAPATLNIIQHVEYNMGAYLPEGGIYSVSSSLYKLAEKLGVNFYFNSEVKEILLNGKKVNGIKVKNETGTSDHFFDVVLSNSDVTTTFMHFIKNGLSKEAARYGRLEPSSSAVVFYWGMDITTDSTQIHNILFSSDYAKEFSDIFEKKMCPADPTVYIYISSKYSPSDAPPGNENWFVMINAPYSDGQNWDEELKRIRSKIISKINSALNLDIDRRIKFEQVMTPPEIERLTGSYRGSLYGISSNDRNAAFLRQRNRSAEFKGLYFCGGSAHPGGGIPLVILSGKIAADLILKDHGGAI